MRYLDHQLKKKETLMKIMKQRHSTRIFSDRTVDEKEIKELIESTTMCPSSCDRKGIYEKIVTTRDDKNFLNGVLVGGVGWIHRAPAIILLFGDPLAYKEKLVYMPFLDAGVVIYHLYLMAEMKGMKACYVNPNVRGDNELFFRNRFGYDIFCGAIALGYA